jgi:hypothetical protein
MNYHLKGITIEGKTLCATTYVRDLPRFFCVEDIKKQPEKSINASSSLRSRLESLKPAATWLLSNKNTARKVCVNSG